MKFTFLKSILDSDRNLSGSIQDLGQKILSYNYNFSLKNIILLIILTLTMDLNDANAAMLDQMKSLYVKNDYKKLIHIFGPQYAKMNYAELVMLGESYKRTKDYERQIKILKLLDQKKPNYFKIHFELAQANKAKAYSSIIEGQEYKLYQKYLNDMTDYYRSSIELEPENPSPYFELMSVFKDQENVPEGLALAKTMLEVFGEKPNIATDLCEWTSKFGLVAQTQKACLRASELSPNTAMPLVYLALSLRDAGEIEKYQVQMLKIYERFPKNETVVDLVGQIHLDNKDYINAEKTLAKNKNTKIENSRINLMAAYFENEKYEQALKYFASSCRLVNEERKKLIRFFESKLRRLEMNEQNEMALKFQREINNCLSTPVVLASDKKIRPGHFSEGIRLPSNASNIEGKTLRDKRYNYEQERKKSQIYVPKSEGSETQSN